MGKVVSLYEYYQECGGCGGIEWYIQYTTDLKDIKQIVCTNPDCTKILENPGIYSETEISFEPDFEMGDV
jgi:hypothetical protein